MKPDNIEIIPMPLSHSHGLRTVYANILNGSSVILIDGVIRTKLFFQLMDQYQATAIDMSPAILNILFKLTKDLIGKYRGQLDYIELGSAPLLDEDKERLMRLLPESRLYNFYGSTEAGRTCTYDFCHEKAAPGCIGKPAVNARYIFVDSSRNEIEATRDNPGLIATAGSQNMAGYFHEPELTASVCENGYIYTTDLGYCDENGYIYCLGRQDNVINCGGIKISPDEIEAEVMRCPEIDDCACVPMADPLQGQVPRVYYVVSAEAEDSFDEKAFMRFIRERLDANKLPKRVTRIDKIPRAANGKILRAQLM
ncbi:MAG: acyl--CoA ligase [Lachnospiraceae bacterium]|nr:acyl--CoA ligase [Lachnospiraceae bacterium]